MSKANEIYKEIIQDWIDQDYFNLEKIHANRSLVPLKTLLLRDTLEETTEDEGFQRDEFTDEDKAYILEASLYKLPFTTYDIKALDLSKEILSKFNEVYFANITCANYYRKNKEFTNAIKFYKKAIEIAPNDERNLTDLIFLLLLQENQKDARFYQTLLKNKTNVFFTKLGIFGMSSKYQKILLGLISGFIALFTPYSFYFFIPTLVLLSICLFFGRYKKNKLIIGVSLNYGFYFVLFFLFSLLLFFM